MRDCKTCSDFCIVLLLVDMHTAEARACVPLLHIKPLQARGGLHHPAMWAHQPQLQRLWQGLELGWGQLKTVGLRLALLPVQ